MLSFLFNAVVPVFILLLIGYASVASRLFSDSMVDTLMRYAIKIGIPCLLFNATSVIDLSSAFNWPALGAFYLAASISFALGILCSRLIFKRRPGESVAIGFGALYSNLVLIGLPITERALGPEFMPMTITLVSIHTPFCYLLGISVMESVRADGRGLLATVVVVIETMFNNSLMIAIALGFLVNISQLAVPVPIDEALRMIQLSAMPLALFGLGGILRRYSLTKSLRESSCVSLLSLVVHPALTLGLCVVLQVDEMLRNVVVLMASTAPGVNAYLFANMYERGQSVAASSVLLSTLVSLFSISVWLSVLISLSS